MLGWRRKLKNSDNQEVHRKMWGDLAGPGTFLLQLNHPKDASEDVVLWQPSAVRKVVVHNTLLALLRY